MAPEQVSGGEVGPAADIYALGVVMYEMVTGVLPFDGGSAMEVALRRLTMRPQPPRRLVPDLDPRWERAILRCLEREPQRRFAVPGQVASALRDPAPRAGVSLPWLVAGVAASLVLGVTGAIWWSGRRAAPATPPPRTTCAPTRTGVSRFRHPNGRANPGRETERLCAAATTPNREKPPPRIEAARSSPFPATISRSCHPRVERLPGMASSHFGVVN